MDLKTVVASDQSLSGSVEACRKAGSRRSVADLAIFAVVRNASLDILEDAPVHEIPQISCEVTSIADKARLACHCRKQLLLRGVGG